MKEEIKIPDMGESITEASIVGILKPSGSLVQEGEEVIEIETEKVNQPLYAPTGGSVEWKVEEGDSVTIGEVIGFVDTEKAVAAPPKEEAEGVVREKVSALPSERVEKEVVTEVGGKRESRKKISKIRKVIAARLVDSLQNSATLTTFNEVDMSAVIEMRGEHKESFQEKYGVKLGLMSFFVKASVEALQAFPQFNSYIDGDELVHREYFDIGIAVGTERGLVVPVVRECDQLSFAEIEKKIADSSKKAREGGLIVEDLQGGGFTITNGGVFGSLLSTPILNPPQVGILGMHNIQKRAVVVEDQIVIRPMMYLALSYDHRVVDGKEAILFLVRVKELLEHPSRLDFSGYTIPEK
ncbi:MAG: Dihydrolipoyllysine-residue succinyltransferase component of 2-oxoglutarate dehydrogenase complex [Chlamydiae bacterium]|nr:Dihydrolipoyllysine-residue succinyltransferase component of 2-oxoglutarate dehydrogenase complex [Chlamydiota bacterium]